MMFRFGSTQYQAKQDGSIMLIILIAIGLFGLLTAALSTNFTNSFDLNDQEARALVSQVKDQETVLRTGYQQLRVAHGCAVEEINFALDADPAYNSNAPANGRCSMYHPAGAGLQPVRLDDLVQTAAVGDEVFWLETAGLEVDELGFTSSGDSACPGCDLALAVYNVNQMICEKLNLAIFDVQQVMVLDGAEEIIPVQFDGTYSNDNLINATDDVRLPGHPAFCIQEGGGAERFIYLSILEIR